MSVREVTTRFIKDSAVTNAKVAANAIDNSKVSASAGIVYSKLDLTGGITNSDVNASAAIAYSKLNLTSSIVNADISNAAAIAYSKLNLAGSIVNADIASGAAIVYSKLSLTNSIVVADIAAGAKASAATASTLVLRDGSGRAQFADPAVAADAATKGYVDGVAQGLTPKAACKVATTAALADAYTATSTTLTKTSNGAFPAQDGVTLALNDRILIKNESTSANNGLYYLSTVGSGAAPWVLTRTTDADDNPTSGEVVGGITTAIFAGTTNKSTTWVLTTTGSITLGTTGLTFELLQDNSFITANAPISFSGNTISHNTSGVTAGTYTSVTVNSYGHVTAGTNPSVVTGYRDSGSATSSQTAINLAQANVASESEMVVIEGVVMDKAAGDYSIVYSTGVITLSTGMTTGERYFVIYRA
jgi:hypothetical protein